MGSYDLAVIRKGGPEIDTALGTVHGIAWAIYVGGAVTMEFILSHAQRTMPPSQVGVVCKTAGMRYRWVALAGLLVIGASGAAMVLRLDSEELGRRSGGAELSLSDAYGRTLLVLALAWAALLSTVAWMAFRLHPAQRKRSVPGMSEEEVAMERRRVGMAIRRMDRALKFELCVAVLAVGIGASLHGGGLI